MHHTNTLFCMLMRPEMLAAAYPEAIASQDEGQMVCHAQKLAKVDATFDSNNISLMHQGNSSLNALLVVSGNHDFCTGFLAQLYQCICTPASPRSLKMAIATSDVIMTHAVEVIRQDSNNQCRQVSLSRILPGKFYCTCVIHT